MKDAVLKIISFIYRLSSNKNYRTSQLHCIERSSFSGFKYFQISKFQNLRQLRENGTQYDIRHFSSIVCQPRSTFNFQLSLYEKNIYAPTSGAGWFLPSSGSRVVHHQNFSSGTRQAYSRN